MSGSLKRSLLAASCFFCGALYAQDAVVNFDDLSGEGTLVELQYQDAGKGGLKFLRTDRTGTTVPLPSIHIDSNARSRPNVGSIREPGCTGEFCANHIVGQFSSPRSHVKVWVGDYGSPQETATVTLRVYDPSGKTASASTTVTGGGGYSKSLEVSSSGLLATVDAFAYFEVSSTASKNIAIDDLTFDAPAGPALPDFSVSWVGGLPVQLTKGGSNVTKLVVKRFASSTGNITFTASGLPSTVTAGFSPNPFSGPDGAEVSLTLSATPAAAPATSATFTVTGTPSPSAGFTPRNASPPVLYTIRDSFDVRVTGIEVSQSVQSFDLPRRGSDPAAPVSYNGGTTDDTGAKLSDQGALLVESAKTVVRVFANLRFAPASGSVPLVDGTLAVCDKDGVTCSTPLKSELGARTLVSGSNFVTDAERADPNGAYTFVLPPSSTKGTITLKAQVSPPPFLGSDLSECTSTECVANNTLVLKDVRFIPTDDVYLTPVALTVDGSSARSPYFVFAEAKTVIPVRDGGVHIPDEYSQSLEIGDIVRKDKSADDRASLVIDRLVDAADDWNLFEDKSLVVGAFPETYGPQIRGMSHTPSRDFLSAEADPCSKSLYCKGKVSIVRGAVAIPGARPRTSVAHELFHMLGRKHASGCGGAGDPASWPPDEKGYLQSVGLDRRGGVWRALLPDGSGPYRILAPGRNGAPPLFYDFMSYCATIGGGDPDSWLSLRYWNDTLRTLASPGAGPLAVPDAEPLAGEPAKQTTDPRPRQAIAPLLIVRGILTAPGEALITKVAPTTGSPAPPQYSSDYHLVARDASGAVLADTPMALSTAHTDSGSETTFLQVLTPAVNAASLEIVFQGNVIGRRQRSANPPTVDLITPQTGMTIGEQSAILIRWRTNRPAAGDLMAKVDYSIGGIERWRPLFFGPNTEETVLPSSRFEGSQCGRVRVRVNDGFNEAAAVSGCFTVVGSVPAVQIVEPAPGYRFVAGAAVFLSGQAHDDGFRPLSGGQLVWSVEGRVVGRGESVFSDGFPQGTSRLELAATDAKNRVGRATLVVVCPPNQANLVCTVQEPSAQGPAPQILQNGIRNAASLTGSAVAPGEIIAISGAGMGAPVPFPMSVHSGLADTLLGGTKVLFDGVAAPLVYVQDTLIRAVVPYSVAGQQSVQVQVEFQGARSNTVGLNVTPSAPGIFTQDQSGMGPGVILNEDGSMNAAGNGALKGSVITIMATGEGQTNPPGLDGLIAGAVLRQPVQSVSVTIRGQPAEVVFAGAVPGQVAGMLQVRVRVPDGVGSGDAVPVVLTIGGASSQPNVVLSVREAALPGPSSSRPPRARSR